MVDSGALEHDGGAVRPIGAGETAFAFRHAAHALEVVPQWHEGDDPDPRLGWMRRVQEAVVTSSLGAGCVNFLGEEGEQRVRAAYGAEIFGREDVRPTANFQAAVPTV